MDDVGDTDDTVEVALGKGEGTELGVIEREAFNWLDGCEDGVIEGLEEGRNVGLLVECELGNVVEVLEDGCTVG